jgi:CRISPR-associated exonuclease Cas4
VEYKRGHAKPNECDEVQLTAQAICLEEMHGTHIDSGALYYGETRHREVILFTDELRRLTQECADDMHTIFRGGTTPKAVKKSHCRSCSLVDICLPELELCANVEHYLKSNLYAQTT